MEEPATRVQLVLREILAKRAKSAEPVKLVERDQQVNREMLVLKVYLA
jgi:hypothetical protein